jgi:hypothetical protein
MNLPTFQRSVLPLSPGDRPEAVQTAESFVTSYQSTWRYTPGDSHLHSHRRENFKSHKEFLDDLLNYLFLKKDKKNSEHSPRHRHATITTKTKTTTTTSLLNLKTLSYILHVNDEERLRNKNFVIERNILIMIPVGLLHSGSVARKS